MDLFITLREASELIGVSRPTLFRAVQRGELAVHTEQVGKTKRILVSKQAVQSWACSRAQAEPVQEQPYRRGFEQAEQVREQSEQVPLTAHLDTVRLLEETQIRLLEATERAHRAERQNDLLKMEVATTRNVLAEHAESLAEKEAIRRQKEELVRERELERAQLEEENRTKQSLYEQEKQQWMMELETTKSRVNSIERRVPKWVRGIFGAS